MLACDFSGQSPGGGVRSKSWCRQEKRPHRLPAPNGGGGMFRSLASEVAAMRGVKFNRQEMVKNMIVGMGEAIRSLQGGDEGLLVLTEVLRCVMDGGDLEEEDDGYYSSSDDEGPVTAEMAARGVGEAGCVVVADSIWNRLVPRDLLQVYSAAQRERGEETTAPAKRGPVDSMLKSLRVDTGGLHVTSAPPTARMFLTYKNKLKCRAILDARRVNARDPRKPPKFRLPALESIRRWMGDARRNRQGGGRVYLAKVDLQNAYWSIRLPPQWRRVFVVQGGSGRKFRYARLPFGWSYSPAICQRLVMAVVRRVLSRGGSGGGSIWTTSCCRPGERRASAGPSATTRGRLGGQGSLWGPRARRPAQRA